jgi:DNA-binding beta-propeller fold protein YncE
LSALRNRCSLLLAIVVTGCASTGAPVKTAHAPTHAGGTARPALPSRSSPVQRQHSVALVTDETENRLLAVDLRSGRITKRITLAADPENVVVASDRAVVVSANPGTVTVLDRRSLQVVRALPGFGLPHIPAISPDGEYAYVTDDARGTLTIIRLSDATAISSVTVGPGAHHLTASPDGRRLWIALGESAPTIVIVEISDRGRPRIIERFDPGFAAHDLAFTPDGRRVWITSANGPEVTVFSSTARRVLFRVPVGPPPQHLAFDRPYAYLTSGYGGTIECVALSNGRLIRRASAPHGSFELDSGGGYVATSSLLHGTLATYNLQLEQLHVVHLAGATRDVAISPP